MTDYYLDASAVVKRYTGESGRIWIQQITDPHAQNTIMLAEITLAEVAPPPWRPNTVRPEASLNSKGNGP